MKISDLKWWLVFHYKEEDWDEELVRALKNYIDACFSCANIHPNTRGDDKYKKEILDNSYIALKNAYTQHYKKNKKGKPRKNRI